MHASSTVGLKVGGTIHLDHCAAEGQTRSNNDFGRRHASLVTGSKLNNEKVHKPIGVFHLIPYELQRTDVITSKENANINKRRFDDASENQFVKRRRKEEIALENKYEDATEDYIVAIYFHEKYQSPRCWIKLEVAAEFYSALGSETARLAAVKEQIIIRYLGLGWELDHHAWYEGGSTFSSEELYKHLAELVIPIADDLAVPPEPPVNIPTLTEIKALGTVSDLAEELETHTENKFTEFKNKSNAEMECCE